MSQKFWKWKIFPLLENCWNWHGGQFWVEKNDSRHKDPFFKSETRFLGVNSQMWSPVALFQEKFCDFISPKLEELKFCTRNAFMDIMTHAKFHFNRLMLTMIIGIQASELWAPPPPLWPGERLKRLGLIGLTRKPRYFYQLSYW